MFEKNPVEVESPSLLEIRVSRLGVVCKYPNSSVGTILGQCWWIKMQSRTAVRRDHESNVIPAVRHYFIS